VSRYVLAQVEEELLRQARGGQPGDAAQHALPTDTPH
jgi:hypothetical protein